MKKGLMGGTHMPEEERARESESGAQLTSGAERTTREGRAWRGRVGRWAEVGQERRGAGAREGGRDHGPVTAQQKKEAHRTVQHVGVQGPFIKSKWSHIPITFSQEDLQLKDYPHNDAKVISCVIKEFLVHNVLVDTGSAADIIFAKAFRQMQEPDDKIHDATHPLCGFGG
jgi:hypothetical protein